MKTKIVTVVSGMALLSGLVISPVVLAASSADVARNLAGSTVLELSANAASLVAKASVAEKKAVAVAAIKTAVGMNPASAVAIVSAVARENPASAPVVAVTAATLQPKRIGLIAKAAAAAAPSEASRIVAALIKEFPQQYGAIAIGAAEGAPLAGREILAVVAESVPALQASIQTATAHFSANSVALPVQAILSESYNQALTSGMVVLAQIPVTLSQGSGTMSSVAAGGAVGVGRVAPLGLAQPVVMGSVPLISPPIVSQPTGGAPFTGSTSSPTTYNTSQTQNEQTGGRVYSAP